jgi:hypothetical protein
MIPNTSDAATPHRRHERLIDRHFGGRSAPAPERELREHLVGCARCRDYYDRHLLLAAAEPGQAVPLAERLARGLGLPAASSRGSKARLWWAAALPAALGVTIAVLVALPAHVAAPLQARGAGTSPGGQLLAYEVSDAGSARPLPQRIAPDSALAFAYANVDRKQRLLVFAIDEQRRVYWYHPAWTNAAEDPVAMTLQADTALHEIPERIKHHLGPGRLQIFGVFTDDVLSVRAVERTVAAAGDDVSGALRRLAPDAELAHFEVNVAGAP